MTAPAVGSSPLPDEGPVSATVSVVAEAVPDSIETVTDQLAPTDATGFGGNDEDSGPVDGSDASASSPDETADGQAAEAVAAVAEGSAAAGDEMAVIEDGISGKVEPVAAAEESAADASVGMEDGAVSSLPAVVDAGGVASSVSLEDEVRLILAAAR